MTKDPQGPEPESQFDGAPDSDESLSSGRRNRRGGSDRRASVVDRRSGLDRRDAPPGFKLPSMERRRGPGIRRPEERRAAEEGELTAEQFEFVMAIEEYKQVNRKAFPTWTEVLDVIKLLGYRKETENQSNPTEPDGSDQDR